MSQPFLDDAFHVRWSTLDPQSVVPDITEALARADRALNTVINQDRGRLTFDGVILAQRGRIAQRIEMPHEAPRFVQLSQRLFMREDDAVEREPSAILVDDGVQGAVGAGERLGDVRFHRVRSERGPADVE